MRRLGYRAQIKSATQARDSYGQPVSTWATAATIWCGAVPLRSEEAFAAIQVKDTTWIKVFFRRSTATEAITGDYRLAFTTGPFAGRTFEMHGTPLPDAIYPRENYLTVRCKEIT